METRRKIILGEGLASFYVGFVRKAYEQELKRIGLEVECQPWTAPINNCYAAIVHSFAAGYACLRDTECEILITLDARSWLFWKNSSYEKPNGVKRHYNFFQSGLMRGWPIKGAINKEIKSNHIGLPKASFDEVMDILKN